MNLNLSDQRLLRENRPQFIQQPFKVLQLFLLVRIPTDKKRPGLGIFGKIKNIKFNCSTNSGKKRKSLKINDLIKKL